jgi:hypothetical protein
VRQGAPQNLVERIKAWKAEDQETKIHYGLHSKLCVSGNGKDKDNNLMEETQGILKNTTVKKC